MLVGYRAWVWLLLLCAALYVPGIASMPVTDRDEARYTQASRQMIETGDMVRIRFQEEARNKKPAGIYWLQTVSVSILSTAESVERWPYRIPSAIGATLAVLFTFLAGLALTDRRTAFLAAALLASSLLLAVEARIAKTDAFLLATVAAAMCALARLYMRGREKRPGRWPDALLLWGAVGVGLLIKGPITPLVAALTVAGLKIFDPRVRWLPLLRPLPGILLAALIAAPWFVAIVIADSDFIRESAGDDFLSKLLSAQESHGFPPGYYLLLMTATFAPASLFVWPALLWAWRRRREAAVLFALLWLVPFWIIVELTPTKLPHYVLPVYPALALLTAMAAAEAQLGLVPRMHAWSTRAVYLLWGALVIGFPIVAMALPLLADGVFVWAGLIGVLAALIGAPVAVRLAWSGRVVPALAVAVVGAPLVFGPVFTSVLPAADRIWVSREAGALVRNHMPEDKRPALFATGYREPSLVFELGTDLRFDEPAPLAAMLPAGAPWLALVAHDKWAEFEAAAADRGLAVVVLGSVDGFNYSRGRRETLTLFGPAP